MNLFELYCKVGLDDKEATKGIDSLSKKGEGLSKVFKGVVGAIGAVTTVAAAVGGAFIKGAMATSDYGSEVNDLSQKMNISKKGFQEWRYILGQSGTDIGVLQMGLKTLSNAAVDGNEAFDKLGISQDELSKLSTEELFNKTILQLSEMEAGTERTALASDLFGRSATELLPILNSGAAGIEEMRKQAEDYGLVMSDEAIAASDAFGDSVSLMKQTLTGMKNRMMGDFLPSLTQVTDGLAKLFTGDTSGLDSINQGITGFVNKIAEALPQVISIGGSILQTLATAIMNNMPMLITTAFNLITQFGMFILQNLPMLLQTALTILTTLALGLAEQAPVLIPAIVEAILTMVDTLINNIDMLVNAAIQLTMGIANGLIAALPLLVQKIPTMVIALVNALVANLPLLIQAAIQIIMALAQGLISAVPQLIAAIPKILMALVQGFAKLAPQLLEIGKNLVKGIWQGISNSFTWIKNQITTWVGNVISFFKKIFGIKSPSTVMKNEIGVQMGRGIGMGIVESYNAFMSNAKLVDPMQALSYLNSVNFTPSITPNVNGYTSSLSASAPISRTAGGLSIGQINFNQPVTSPIQTANRINRELAGVLYA